MSNTEFVIKIFGASYSPWTVYKHITLVIYNLIQCNMKSRHKVDRGLSHGTPKYNQIKNVQGGLNFALFMH